VLSGERHSPEVAVVNSDLRDVSNPSEHLVPSWR
jgi:hypothetical protein